MIPRSLAGENFSGDVGNVGRTPLPHMQPLNHLSLRCVIHTCLHTRARLKQVLLTASRFASLFARNTASYPRSAVAKSKGEGLSCNVSVFPPAYREKSDNVNRLEIHWPAKSSKAQQFRKRQALAHRLLVNKSKTPFMGKHKPEKSEKR